MPQPVSAVPLWALAALLGATELTAQDLRRCDPSEFTNQSGIPRLATYVDAGEGLAIGRGGSRTPFVASLQGSLLWSQSIDSRRLAFGPLAGFTYANPRVHGLLGARLRYRVLP